MEVFLLPMKVFYFIPPFGIVPAILFFNLYRRSKRIAAIVPAAIWLIYACYECYLWYGIHTGASPQREDLQIITPILYVATFLGIVSYVQYKKSH